MNRFIAINKPSFENALCQQYDPNIWFDATTAKRAIKLCGQCADREACLTYALTLPDDTEGVFAGLTSKQLKPMRKANGNPKFIDHGTMYGYTQHRRYGIPACRLCLDANAANKASRVKKYRERQKQKLTTNTEFEHGTTAGHTKHYLVGTPPCEACKKAKAEYQRQRYHRNK